MEPIMHISAWLIFLTFTITGAPTGDLASLVDPAETLQQMQVQVTEETLINILDAQDAADTGDAYVKKLMAIRALEEMKARTALPALREIAGGDDITLAAAAKRATARITGNKVPLPRKQDVIKQLSANVPKNVGFVSCVVLAHQRQETNLQSRFQLMKKKMPMMKRLLSQSGQMEQRLVPQARQVLRQTLSTFGNFRIDGAVMFLPPNVGENAGYAAAVIKGLYDQQKVSTFCENRYKKKTIEGHTVYYEPHGPAIYPMDKNTLILSSGPQGQARHMKVVLDEIQSAKPDSLPDNARDAFRAVREGHSPWAVSGALSAQEKTKISEWVQSEDKKIEKLADNHPGLDMMVAFTNVIRNIPDVNAFAALSGKKNNIKILARCKNDKAANSLDEALKSAEEIVRDKLLQQVKRPMIAEFVGDAVDPYRKGKTIWETKTDGNTLKAQINPKIPLFYAFLYITA